MGGASVASKLVTSTLWTRRLIVPHLHRDLLEEIPLALVDFWTNQHWIMVTVLYQPVQGEGKAMVSIECRVISFRLQAALSFLYQCALIWLGTAYLFPQKASCLSLASQLLAGLEGVDLHGLYPFYQPILHVVVFASGKTG